MVKQPPNVPEKSESPIESQQKQHCNQCVFIEVHWGVAEAINLASVTQKLPLPRGATGASFLRAVCSRLPDARYQSCYHADMGPASLCPRVASELNDSKSRLAICFWKMMSIFLIVNIQYVIFVLEYVGKFIDLRQFSGIISHSSEKIMRNSWRKRNDSSESCRFFRFPQKSAK